MNRLIQYSGENLNCRSEYSSSPVNATRGALDIPDTIFSNRSILQDAILSLNIISGWNSSINFFIPSISYLPHNHNTSRRNLNQSPLIDFKNLYNFCGSSSANEFLSWDVFCNQTTSFPAFFPDIILLSIILSVIW